MSAGERRSVQAEPANEPTPARKRAREEVSLPNPHLRELEGDFLYHIGYDRDEIRDIFQDVKFVVMGGSPGRMGSFAEVVAKEINHPTCRREELDKSKTDRYALYKIGPVLSISHGMGVPSVTILLHEVFKLLHYAGAKDAILFRIGTSGGLGVPAGTLVISNRTFNALLKEEHETIVLGKKVARPSIVDQKLAQALLDCQSENSFRTVLGTTMCTDDFYEGQGRVDGALCDHTHQEKMDYLSTLHKAGVVNIEMESSAMAALCNKAGFSCGVVCVTLLDRLHGDQVVLSPEVYKEYAMRPQRLVASFIKSRLNNTSTRDV